jgi:hypothetical protein
MKMKRTALTFSIRFWAIVLIALLIYQFSSNASADDCKFEKKIEKTLDLSNSELLSITAAAGDLEVAGVPGTHVATIHGRVCASKEEWLESSDIYTAAGKHAEISANLPDTDSNWSFGNTYLMLDMHIEVPDSLALDVRDSSGDMLLKNIADVQIKDSSGDIEIERALGTVTISDSSGEIDIDGAEGDITIESDSSGDIGARDINGSVLVVSDSSGDIDVSRVSDNFVVERDSSGDISASDVGGDFRVLRDGSGGIRSNGVKGEVQIPDKD